MKHVAIQMVVTGNDWLNALSEAYQFAVKNGAPVLLTYRGQKSWTISPDTTTDEIEAMRLEQFRIGV
jgi:hypothetical protein